MAIIIYLLCKHINKIRVSLNSLTDFQFRVRIKTSANTARENALSILRINTRVNTKTYKICMNGWMFNKYFVIHSGSWVIWTQIKL